MILDAQLEFSKDQVITASARSTNTLDMGRAGGNDIGTGEELYVAVVCTEAMTDSGSDSTVKVSLEGDSTDTITPDAIEDLFTFPALSPAGTVKYARLNPGSAPLQLRYNSLYYTVANGNLSTGKFSAYIVKDIQKFLAYADNSKIS